MKTTWAVGLVLEFLPDERNQEEIDDSSMDFHL
jgi:hypothetical protein